MRPAWAAFAASTSLLAALGPTAASAQDSSQVRYLAANCANCHGTGGNSAGAMPSLAGQPRDYLVAQMQAFKAGSRPATIMHQIAKGYTDAQIASMADYFSRQPRK